MAKASSADLTTIADLIDSGDVTVTISGRFPPDKVADAQAEQEKGGSGVSSSSSSTRAD